MKRDLTTPSDRKCWHSNPDPPSLLGVRCSINLMSGITTQVLEVELLLYWSWPPNWYATVYRLAFRCVGDCGCKGRKSRRGRKRWVVPNCSWLWSLCWVCTRLTETEKPTGYASQYNLFVYLHRHWRQRWQPLACSVDLKISIRSSG